MESVHADCHGFHPLLISTRDVQRLHFLTIQERPDLHDVLVPRLHDGPHGAHLVQDLGLPGHGGGAGAREGGQGAQSWGFPNAA